MSVSRKIALFVKREVAEVLPPTIYFLCTFNIIALTTSMILQEFGIVLPLHLKATALAMVVGKVVLVVNKMRFLRRFDGSPLIYPILFKSIIYTIFVFVTRLLEEWIHALIDLGRISGTGQYMSEHIVWDLFLAAQIWIFVLLALYVTAVEVSRILGFNRRQWVAALFKDQPQGIIARIA